MKSNAKNQAEKVAVKKLHKKSHNLKPEVLVKNILAGDRVALSQSITLCESTTALDQKLALEIVRQCLPYSGQSIRVGITGVPGVGKSTFIEALGSHLTAHGKRVAVLAVDPSSPISGGSILGDKTRMEKLSHDESAFIRPSPAAKATGGVAQSTRQAIILCEAAGFDVVLIETMGVGQSEITVHGMTDFFLLLMLAGAGDQLQGIKRGIMEMADGIIITKADEGNEKNASHAKGEYLSALHLFPPRENGLTPKVEITSALHNKGIAETWKMISTHEQWMKERNLFAQNRKQQEMQWVRNAVKEHVANQFFSRPDVSALLKRNEKQLEAGKISGFDALQSMLGLMK